MTQSSAQLMPLPRYYISLYHARVRTVHVGNFLLQWVHQTRQMVVDFLSLLYSIYIILVISQARPQEEYHEQMPLLAV